MNGYVKNRTPIWAHAMKRVIGPGAKVTLDELYEQYGKKHEIPEGEPFVEWLREVKLQDKEKWEIIFAKEAKDLPPEPEEVEKKPEIEIDKNSSPSTYKNLDVEDIVQLSVRSAREVLPKITDIKLLKFALKEASPRPGKDSLCNILRKRIKELQLTH